MKAIKLVSICAAVILASCAPKQETTALFNGQNLEGWVCFVDPEAGVPADQVFSVRDGMIAISGQPFGYIRTAEMYGDYTFHAEWRWVGEGTNSGLFQRIQDGDKLWPEAIECQLCAGKAGDYVCLGGARIDEVPFDPEVKFPVLKRNTEEDIEKPAGEWNEADVICQGKNIKVYINGKLVNECNGQKSEGYIALQSEGGPLELRNITITK